MNLFDAMKNTDDEPTPGEKHAALIAAKWTMRDARYEGVLTRYIPPSGKGSMVQHAAYIKLLSATTAN